MRRLATGSLLGLGLAACAQHPGTPAPHASVWKSFGSVQCGAGGATLAEQQRQLEQAGVTVASGACGHDGRMRVTLCGAPDGRIGIFEIEQADAAAARQLGFEPLARLPEAERGTCR